MKHKLFNLFLITESLNGLTQIPIQSFISSDYDTAKLYFHDWLEDKKAIERFKLYKIGEVNKELRVKEMKIYITGGYEEKYKQRNKFGKTEILKEKEKYKEAIKKNNIKEIIGTLFEGKEI